MSILEKDFKSNFTQIPNSVLNDKTLSYKAKGLFAFMVSKPDKWEFSLNGLVSQSKETRQSILNIMNELIESGYMTKIKNRINGRQATNNYKLHLEPNKSLFRSKSKILTQKNKLSKTDSVNHTTSNTITSNKDKNNTYSNTEKINFNSFRKDFMMIHSKEHFYTKGLGWKIDTPFLIKNDLIFNTVSNKHVSKDEAYKIWSYLYENIH